MFAAISMVLFAGFLVFYGWAWVAVGPARAYSDAALCPAGAPADAPCLVRGTATIAKTVNRGAFQSSVHGGHSSTTSQWDVTITGHGQIPDATFSVFASYPLITGSKVGDTVTVTVWRGSVDTVTNRLGSAQVGVSPVGDLRTVDFMAAFLLTLASGSGWLGRVRLPRRQRWPRVSQVLRRVWLPGIALGTILVAMGVFEAGLVLTAAAGLPALGLYLGTHVGKPRSKRSAGPAQSRAESQAGSRAEKKAGKQSGDERRSDGCPVSVHEQAWIERSMDWFTGQFGYEPVRRATIEPTSDFFPGTYSGSDADVQALVRRICGFMRVDPDAIAVQFLGEAGEDDMVANLGLARESHYAAGTFHRDEDGRFVVELDRANVGSPERLTAVIAHELGHVRLLGEGRISADREDNEPLTDLVTVYFGLGIFTANAAFVFTKSASGRSWSTSSLGYLDERMFGYALACYARLHQDRKTPWAKHLTTNPRTYMRHGMEYLDRAAPRGGFPTLSVAASTGDASSATAPVV